MTTAMAPTPMATAFMSWRAMARDSHEPIPGRVTVVFPTVIASDATTKNQPPDIDIITFHTRPGVANGSSSRTNRRQGEKAN
jgi:hypothetical protein